MSRKDFIDRVIKNGRLAKKMYGEPLTVKELVLMLDVSSRSNRHPAIKINSKILLEMMEKKAWVLIAGIHKGGRGGKDHPLDETSHLTLQIGKKRMHHIRADKRGHFFQILGPNMKPIPPWMAPGA